MTLLGSILGGLTGVVFGYIAVHLAKLKFGPNDEDYRAFARNGPLGFVGLGILIGAIIGEFFL